MISTARLSDIFVEVADTLVDDFDLVLFLQTLTNHVADVGEADAVGLLLADQRGTLKFMAASNESAHMLELFQLQNHEGPCLDCYTSGQPVENRDLTEAVEKWPVFAPKALAAGFGSAFAFPMRLREQVIGTLNIFGREHPGFGPDDARIIQGMADIATIAILQERNISRAEALTEQLQGALNSRIVIEQAKGALARIEGVGVEEAFEILRSRARSSRRRLVDVAAEVLQTR